MSREIPKAYQSRSIQIQSHNWSLLLTKVRMSDILRRKQFLRDFTYYRLLNSILALFLSIVIFSSLLYQARSCFWVCIWSLLLVSSLNSFRLWSAAWCYYFRADTFLSKICFRRSSVSFIFISKSSYKFCLVSLFMKLVSSNLWFCVLARCYTSKIQCSFRS